MVRLPQYARLPYYAESATWRTVGKSETRGLQAQ